MRKTITVNRPAEEIYAFWRNLENLPRVMDYLESVYVDGVRSHWKAIAPAHITLEWDAVTTEDKPNELIAWQSVEGSSFETSGSVRFRPAPANRGTEVELTFEFDPPGGILGDAAVKILRVAPDVMVNKALYTFKSYIETGEIPTTKNQPAARDGGRDE
jgi:uncharacterized membrane protein